MIQFSNCNVNFLNDRKTRALEIDYNLKIENKRIQLTADFFMFLKFGDVKFSMCNNDLICLN